MLNAGTLDTRKENHKVETESVSTPASSQEKFPNTTGNNKLMKNVSLYS